MTQYGSLPPDSDVWHFPAHPERIVDGDTLDMTFDLGLRMRASKQRVRLYGVDTAEIYGVDDKSATYKRGVEQMGFVEKWLSSGGSEFPYRCYVMKGEGKYGRWLVDVLDGDGKSLVAALYDEFGDEVKPED